MLDCFVGYILLAFTHNSVWVYRIVIQITEKHIRLYFKSSLTLTLTLTLTLNEWSFNLSFPWVSVLFLNSWRVSVVPYYVTTHPPAIQKLHWHSREAHFELPLFECEWAFRIRAIVMHETSSPEPKDAESWWLSWRPRIVTWDISNSRLTK
jgi:hypothetical protein